MFFYLSKLLWLLIQPSNVLLLAMAAGLAARLSGLRRLAAGLLYPAVVVFVIVSVVPVGQWLLAALEGRFPPPENPPATVDGVVVLGGAVDLPISEARDTVEVGMAGDRIDALVYLANRYPEAEMIYSAGLDWLGGTAVTEAAAVRDLLSSQGVSVERVYFEDQARNTSENAQYAMAHAQPAPGETWLLVTSAYHMPRAVGVFRQAGWPVVAWPVDYRTRGRGDWWPPDAAYRLVEFDTAVKEWVGLAAYAATGRTDALFPSP